MKTKLFIIAAICSLALNAEAQTPFTTIVNELIKGTQNATTKTFAETGAASTPTKEVPLNFFNNNSLSINLINTTNRLSLSSEVLHYKLYIANPDDTTVDSRTYRFNIPVLLISKLSTQYDTENSATSWDVLDYEAAPVTLRLMPSFKHKFKGKKDVIYYGFYTDLRGLNMHNNATNEYDMEFIGSGGVGFTFEGDGEAGKYNENGEYTPGKYSLSFIFQGATGKKEILQKLFDTKDEYVTSIQTYFLFRVDKDSKFNLKIGYQYLFQETLAEAKSNFSIALGI